VKAVRGWRTLFETVLLIIIIIIKVPLSSAVQKYSNKHSKTINKLSILQSFKNTAIASPRQFIGE